MLKTLWIQWRDRFVHEPITSIAGVIIGITIIATSGGAVIPILSGVSAILLGTSAADTKVKI